LGGGSSLFLTNCASESFYQALDKSGYFQNNTSTRIGQPDLYQHMFNWINSDNNHRLLFIGFDGCRADAISKYISIEKSSVLAQYQRTGELLLGYCGGLNQSYPTSTSPGWTALLTGE
jgi:predicted AlkP superfamily pyrophosphatase or phosphodiesterase